MNEYVRKIDHERTSILSRLPHLDIELTERCNNDCVHCCINLPAGDVAARAREMSTEQVKGILRQAVDLGCLQVRYTGGEPLLRPDIFDLAHYGTRLGLRMVMAPNGTLITKDIAHRLAEAGIQRLSVSLDGASADTHDEFRKVPGAFDGALRGIELIKQAGIPFQINTTVTQFNLDQIPEIQKLAVDLGAVAHHIFLLVPTGRGKYIVDQAITAEEGYEALITTLGAETAALEGRRVVLRGSDSET